jgi:hypothetical protein
MTSTIRSTQIESAVRATLRGGARQVRVIVDYRNGRVEIEALAEAEPPRPRTFDTIDFRADR